MGRKADLLVVGNVGLSTIAGRLLGSVPANVARRAVDVRSCAPPNGRYQPRARHSLRLGRSAQLRVVTVAG